MTPISAVAQANEGRGVNAVDQGAGLVRGQHWRLAARNHMLRAADGMCRVGGEHPAGNQPVEQHADCRQVLLHSRLLEILSKRVDIGRDVQRLDVGQLTDLFCSHQAKNRLTATL